MLPPHIAALNQVGPSSPPSAHPFPSAHTPFVPNASSSSSSSAANPYGYPELHAPHSHHHAHGHGTGASTSASGAASPLTLDFQQSELDLNAALARQLEEWTNVDFSFDDGGVGVGMGIGLKSEGPAGLAGGEGQGNGPQGQGEDGGGGGGGGGDGDGGHHSGAAANGQPNGGAAGQPDDEEEKWDTKKGKGIRFASSRRLHERLEQSGAPPGEPQAQNQGQQAQPAQQGLAGSSAFHAANAAAGPGQNAMAGPSTQSAHGTPFPSHPPMLPGGFPPQIAQGQGTSLALDANLMAFLQSMYQSQLASQFGAQAQAWVAHQQGQGHGHGQGQGLGGLQGGMVQQQQQGQQQQQQINGHGNPQQPNGILGQQGGHHSPAHASGINTPTSANANSYYPAFAIDALTTLSDPGVWGGILGGGNGRAAAQLPNQAGPSQANDQGHQSARPGSSRAVDPSVVAPPPFDPSRSRRVSPRPTSSRKQSANSAADADGDNGAHTANNSVQPNGSARGKKRQRSSTLGRNEREESTSDRSGTGDGGQGDAQDSAGGIPAGTPAGNGMVYAANGEIISHEEDKRRRNTEASARFRMKKKEREQAVERKKQELEDKCSRLERENNGLRKENAWLKALLVNGTPQPLNSPSPLEPGDASGSRSGPKGKREV